MNKTFKYVLCTVMVLITGGAFAALPGANAVPEKPHKTFTNPLHDGADPWITKHDGKYYTCRSARRGIVVTESRFLTRPERSEVVWDCAAELARDSSLAWTAYSIWAPEIHCIEGKWYIFYAGGSREVRKPPYTWQRAGVLVSDNPFGPYKCRRLFTGDDPLQNLENDIWGIDMTHLELDGKHYAIWSGWPRQVNDNSQDQLLYIARIEQLGEQMTLGQRHLLSAPEQSWERKADGEWISLVEGASALEHNGEVFILYSTRGSWTQNYKLGLLRLTDRSNPLDKRSWEKHGPAFADDDPNDEIFGVGHASYTTSPDDTEHWIFYHSKKSRTGGWNRQVFLQPFTFDKATGLPCFGKPTGIGAHRRPSGEYSLEKRLCRENR